MFEIKISKITRIWNQFQAGFQRTLKNDGIVTRPTAGPGIFAAFLLPLAILIGGSKVKSASPLYTSTCIYSLNLLLNAASLIFYISTKKTIYILKKFNFLQFLLLSSVGFLSIKLYSDYCQCDFKRSLCFIVSNALIYYEGLPFLMKVLPKSLTFGEANIVIQGLSIFIFSSLLRLNKIFLYGGPRDEYNTCTTILQVGLIGLLILCIISFSYKPLQKPLLMYLWAGFVLFAFVTPILEYILNGSPFIWLWNFFTKPERVWIMSLWLVCLIGAGFVVSHQISINKQASTIVRKTFHVLIVTVFVTGVVYDTTLLYLSSGGVLAVFIVLEVFRVLKLPPLYNFLQLGFKVYADEKDSGLVGLTAMYLLIGCSLPLWLHPSSIYSNAQRLQLLSGVMSIGIGDTFASIIGKRFGKHHWEDSGKTVEGTVGCIFGQMLFVQLLVLFGCIPNDFRLLSKAVYAILLSSVTEAFTDQVDNIIMPFMAYIILIE